MRQFVLSETEIEASSTQRQTHKEVEFLINNKHNTNRPNNAIILISHYKNFNNSK